MCFNSLMLCNPERCISIGLTCMFYTDLETQLIASCSEMKCRSLQQLTHASLIVSRVTCRMLALSLSGSG